MKFIKDTTSSEACVYLDLEGLQLPNMGFDPEPLLHFNADTYSTLKPSAAQDRFDITFYYPNLFLETLNDQEKLLFAATIITMHYSIITEINPENINLDSHNPDVIRNNDMIMYRLEDKLAQRIASLDDPDKLNLYERLQWFCNENVTIEESDDVGEAPQHTPEKTFYLADQRILAALFVLCKLFTVILGVFIERCKQIELDHSLIDIHAYTMFKYILRNDKIRAQLYDKLVNYITNVIVKAMEANKNGMSANCIYNGDTLDIIIDKTLSQLFARKAVITDLMKKDSKLMKYIFSSIRQAAQNYHKGSKDKIRILYRDMPRGSDSKGEENNDSMLEVESANTKNTADTDMIISFAVQDIVNRYTTGYGFDRDMVDSAIAYYSTINHLTLNITNSYILGILFGNDLMGAKSIELLSSKDLAALVTIAQLYFINNGYDELIHLVSLAPTTYRKEALTGGESRLRSAYMNNQAYRACSDRFTFTIANISWCTSLGELINDITTNRYTVDTANAIWSMMDRTPTNGIDYIAPDTLGEVICRLILDCTENEGQRDGILHL